MTYLAENGEASAVVISVAGQMAREGVGRAVALVPRHTRSSEEVLTLFVPGVPRERFVLELLEIRQSGRHLIQEEWAEFDRPHAQYMI